MNIIDAHAHIFPDKIALKASHGISDFYDLEVRYDGKVSTLLNISEPFGVTRFVVHSVATTPAQVKSINDFIEKTVNSMPQKFFGFASLHPDCDDIYDIVSQRIKAGMHGIKLHPDFQEFEADSKAAMSMYEQIDARLPVLIHAGDFRKPYSKPARILNAAKAFPKQLFIAAHMGGWSEWEDAVKLADCPNVYVDTCSTQGFVTPERMRELIDAFTPDRVFFGTDYPMWNPERELEALRRILSPAEQEKIFALNFEKAVLHGSAT